MIFWIVISIVIVILIFFSLGVIGFFFGTLFGAPFVPTEQKTVDKMIDLAGNMQNKTVYDLGCGDGRLLFAAEKKGAKPIGVEISFPVYLLAHTRRFFQKSKAKIFCKSLWKTNLQDADIIFLYLLPKMMKRFEEEKFSELQQGTLIISHGFSFPKSIPIQEISGKKGYGKILVYKK